MSYENDKIRVSRSITVSVVITFVLSETPLFSDEDKVCNKAFLFLGSLTLL